MIFWNLLNLERVCANIHLLQFFFNFSSRNLSEPLFWSHFSWLNAQKTKNYLGLMKFLAKSPIEINWTLPKNKFFKKVDSSIESKIKTQIKIEYLPGCFSRVGFVQYFLKFSLSKLSCLESPEAERWWCWLDEPWGLT